MASKLIIVESPTKAKTIKKYVDKNFSVIASYGHICELSKKNDGIIPSNSFYMNFVDIERNKKHIKKICTEAKNADEIFLAADPDREGEAICWHIYERLEKNLINKNIHRISFNEITNKTVNDAICQPREINMNLVNAQLARRALDYLVGFNLSPLLWKKIKIGLSAGRVQSPALRLICERDEEIKNFIKKEYWEILLLPNIIPEKEVVFNLYKIYSNNYEKNYIEDEETANKIKLEIEKFINDDKVSFVINMSSKKNRRKKPNPPFITSTMQQEASSKLQFSPKKTMQIAQQLYEGVDIFGRTTGLITYMRTDSLNLSQGIIKEIRNYVSIKYGSDKLPTKENLYKSKVKNAQEAHEAIRPVSIENHPEKIKDFLTSDQNKLYGLIWSRAVASQMKCTIYENISANIEYISLNGDKYIFQATNSIIKDKGFLNIIDDKFTGKENYSQSKHKLINEMILNRNVIIANVEKKKTIKEPPSRYSEAALIKKLEENGIGRPSTYATIISTLINRKYAFIKNRTLNSTDIGNVVNKFLSKYFGKYVDYEFTSRMEKDLDDISNGKKNFLKVLEKFWDKFSRNLNEILTTVSKKQIMQEKINEKCPDCNNNLVICFNKSNEKFIGCSNFPVCRYTKSIASDNSIDNENNDPDIDEKLGECPECGNLLIKKHSRYGKFIGCSNYPKCKYIKAIKKETGVNCPQCHIGVILERKTKKSGKIFYSCSKYPECKYAIWNQPINEPCPKCGWKILIIKKTKKYGSQKICPEKNCNYIIND